MLKIIKKINEIIAKKKKVEIEPISSLPDEKYEEIQAFVYKDLDLLKKKTEYAAYIQNLPQPLSAEAQEKIRQRKIELSRLLDNLIRSHGPALEELKKVEELEAKVRKQATDFSISPIPRHLSTPEEQ